MPQLVALAFIGAGLYAGYRFVKSAASVFTAELKSKPQQPKTQPGITEKDLGALEFDPKSGVYKPVKGD